MQLSDVKHLATLARLDIPESEQEALLGDLTAILGYIDQVQNAPVGGAHTVIPVHHNSVREDAVTTEAGQYTDILLDQAVGKQDNFVVVKKIL